MFRGKWALCLWLTLNLYLGTNNKENCIQIRIYVYMQHRHYCICLREIDKANVTCYCLGNLGYGYMEIFILFLLFFCNSELLWNIKFKRTNIQKRSWLFWEEWFVRNQKWKKEPKKGRYYSSLGKNEHAMD